MNFIFISFLSLLLFIFKTKINSDKENTHNDTRKIDISAWCYNNLNRIDYEQRVKDLDVTLFGKDESSDYHSDMMNSNFHNPTLIQKIIDKITDSIFSVGLQTIAAAKSKKNLLLICTESFGSSL